MRFSPSGILLIVPVLLSGQQTAGLDEAMRVGPGVKPPKLIHKIEPEYSHDARAGHVQGTTVIQLIVDEHGNATDITVLSPLGFGLDEKARAAIETWKFTPGSKDGKPVKILATVEVNFRFPDIWFDAKAEHRRTAFNVALAELDRKKEKDTARAVKTIQDLAHQKYPPAMGILGEMLYSGDLVEKDPEQALALITKAADKNYGPAMFDLGVIKIGGKLVAADPETGLRLIRDAAVLGSIKAQLYLGQRYEAGDGVPRELDRARRYFRLCAAAGERACQFRLAKLLIELPERREHEYLQAIAWAQLAGDQGLEEARKLADAEMAKITSEQADWVRRLMAQFNRKH
jgi:TonB family protein